MIIIEKFGFFDTLVKDNCLSLLTLGNVVYPCFVRLFYANLEIRSSPNNVFFESVVKNVRITLSHSVLETIFSLKFIDNASLHLTRKLAYKKPHCIMSYFLSLICYITCLLGSFTQKTTLKRPPNEIALKVVYRLMNGYFVDYASIILHHMYRIANLNNNPSCLMAISSPTYSLVSKCHWILRSAPLNLFQSFRLTPSKPFVFMKLSLVVGNTFMI